MSRDNYGDIGPSAVCRLHHQERLELAAAFTVTTATRNVQNGGAQLCSICMAEIRQHTQR
jgi:hypothetical protein